MERINRMTEHNLFYYPYASFTNMQLPFLKVVAVYFEEVVITGSGRRELLIK